MTRLPPQNKPEYRSRSHHPKFVFRAQQHANTMNNNNNKSAIQWKKEDNDTVDNSSDDNSSMNKESELSFDDTSLTNKSNSYKDEVSDTSEDDLAPALCKTALYETKAWELWSKFHAVASTEFLRELKRQWLDAFQMKSFVAQRENADLVIMCDLLPKLDNLFLQMKEELHSFTSVNANKAHRMAAIRDELE
jgi:hypothetical protein